MKYLVIISGIVGLALLYLLSSATANTDLFSQNYYVLLAMTGVPQAKASSAGMPKPS